MKTHRIPLFVCAIFMASLPNVFIASAADAPIDPMIEARTIATFGLMSPRLLNTLNLTPDQLAKIELSKKSFREAQRSYLSELRVLRTEVGDKLFAPHRIGEPDVTAQIKKMADLREKFVLEGFRIALDVRSVLRPDQLAKAAAIRQQLQGIQSEIRELYDQK